MSETDLVQQRYAEVSYPGGAFSRTHPARLAAIAGLFGLETPPMRMVRVLELGCAQGFNLLPMAAHLPEAHFTGLDFSKQEIALGRQLATEAGLSNVQLLCADLRTFTPEPESFDFIIAHGVLSWVPDDVKEALFTVCARALAPDGLALISYNTYPGWKQREAIRDLMLLHSAQATDAAERLAAARSVLDTLESVLAGRAESHAALNREIIASMRKKKVGHFYHDDLDGVNDPCYFLQFVQWAGEHGLQYLTDAATPMLGVEFLPSTLRTTLAGMDRLMLEQHLDFAFNRTFRSSLLCRAGKVLSTHPDPSALRECCFGSALGPAGSQCPLDAETSVRFGEGHPQAFASNHPVVKALFTTLAAAWPRRVSYSELSAFLTEKLQAAAALSATDIDRILPLLLLDACGRKRVDFMKNGVSAATPSGGESPDVPLLTRLMAARGLPTVNRWHEMHKLEPLVRQVLATLDGSHKTFTPAERQVLQKLTAHGFLC